MPNTTGADATHVTSIDSGTRLSVGATTVILGSAAWSGGALNVMDQIVPPGLIVPPHYHEKDHQGSYVVRGTLGFLVGDEEFELGAGSYIHRPAGKVHALWNATEEPAQMLEITAPGEGFETYMLALSSLTDSGSADPESVRVLAALHGVHLVPEPLAALCEKHGVSPAGGFWK
ncbi:cupin domain-containing protein [Streptomyces chartreusis]|uniref:cupin domain-containing protein n=1 Tax=Streptomyces chartreusis TaxID=1969 RepID=UPI0036848BA0